MCFSLSSGIDKQLVTLRSEEPLGTFMLDILPFTKYTKEPLPPRVRSLLEGSFQAAWRCLEPALKRSVVDYEQRLFKLADSARSTQEQGDHFAAMRELRRRSVDLEIAMREVLQRGIVGMVTSQELQRIGAGSREASAPLGLVETAELEESLALSEFSAKAEMRYSSSLHLLSYRFAAIAGCPPIDHELLPLGPNAMADGLKAAGRCMDLTIEQRVRFYHFVDKVLLADYGALLDAVNAYLVEHKVLPHFQHVVTRVRPESGGSADRGKDVDHPDSTEREFREAAEAAEPRPAPVARSPRPAASGGRPESAGPTAAAAEPAAADFEPTAAAAAGAFGHPAVPAATTDWRPADAPSEPTSRVEAASPVPTGSSGSPAIIGDGSQRPAFQALRQLWSEQAPQPTAPAMPAEQTEEDQAEVFASLRELMIGRRAKRGDQIAVGEDRPAATAAELQSVLKTLQSQPATPVMVGGRWQSRSMADIKHDLLNGLRVRGKGAPPTLSDEDNDTVDLVGMLFEQLTTGLSPVSISHGLLTKLQVPLLKVALNDKGFFTRRSHPARRLLNEVAEAAALWVEDESADKVVLDKMQLVVDRITRDYDQDHEIFEQQLDDLGGHLQAVRRKAEIAEKRQVDAARGREKMELSRAAALETIQVRVDAAQPPAPIGAFLLEAWTDVLALSLLRQGPHGKDFEHDLDTADELLALTDQDLPIQQRRVRFEGLVGRLRDGTGAVGMHEGAFEKARSALFSALQLGDSKPAAASRQEIDDALKNRPRLGGEPGSAPVGTILDGLRRGERIQLNAEERAMVDRVKQLPFGTWFEFVKNQQGEQVRRKLSWFSPVTGRCLFVNPRGVKAEDRTIEQLSRELVRGTARVVVETRERLIDRAWKAILRAFSSEAETVLPSAAGAKS